ncbi:hypothetical protein, partial [Streptomyces turgidiscabies]|uniref:hypothetical protein n=1 Tax=Streptomyces turgidiscabies TaxID=85558 RepID=UPI0038F7098A
SQAVDAGIAGANDSIAQLVRQGVLANLSKPVLPLPTPLAVDIADGVARLKPISVDMPAGTASGSASIDLAALTFAADWRLSDKLLSGNGRE